MKANYLRTVLLVLGIMGIVAYIFYPEKKEIEYIEKDSFNFYPYGDSASGMAFVEIGQSSFRCGLLNENGNCGFGFSFDSYKNWNLMDSLILEFEISGNFRELIVQILTNHNTVKPMLKELMLAPNKNRYAIAMEHFYTPDYWFEQQKAKDYENAKRFSAVTGIQIFTGWNNETDRDLELKIDNIYLEGANNVPFVLLVIYIGILITIAIGVRIKN